MLSVKSLERENIGTGEAGGGGGCATGGGETDTGGGCVPVNTNGLTMFPALPLTEKTRVWSRTAVPLPVSNSKLTVSPSVSA